jgi:hypothetical protein
VLVEFTASDYGGPFIEQTRQAADQSRLSLAALAEQDNVVTCEQCSFHLGAHGLVDPDHARERIASLLQHGDQVGAHFIFDAAQFMAART